MNEDDGFCDCITKALDNNRCPRCDQKLTFVATGVIEPRLTTDRLKRPFEGHLKCTCCELTIHELCE